MIPVCPTCGTNITEKWAIHTTVNRGGIYAVEINCPVCQTFFRIVRMIVRRSTLTPTELEKTRNQHR